jgi:hypothetical protein
MVVPVDAPQWVRELLEGLGAAGFVPIEESGDHEPFGNYYTTYRRSHLRVRPVKDRGPWRVDMTDDRQPVNTYAFLPWTSMAYVRAVANGLTDRVEIPPADNAEEVVWLLENLDTVARLVSQADTWQCIREFNRQCAEQRSGIEPPD